MLDAREYLGSLGYIFKTRENFLGFIFMACTQGTLCFVLLKEICDSHHLQPCRLFVKIFPR